MSSTSPCLPTVPLFPLHTVLFPDGLLPLKIFEARYLDMARDCLREKTPFGVCMLKSGGEVAQPDEPSVPESIGCLAEIEECDVETFGMLLVQRTRYAALPAAVASRGTERLAGGDGGAIADDMPLEGNEQLAKFGACAEVLERIIATIRERDPNSLPFAEPFRLDDPTWVSNRLVRSTADSPARAAKVDGVDGRRRAHRCRSSLHAAASVAVMHSVRRPGWRYRMSGDLRVCYSNVPCNPSSSLRTGAGTPYASISRKRYPGGFGVTLDRRARRSRDPVPRDAARYPA